MISTSAFLAYKSLISPFEAAFVTYSAWGASFHYATFLLQLMPEGGTNYSALRNSKMQQMY